MADLENTIEPVTIEPVETPPTAPAPEPVVRNPEKLLELFNAQKAEMAALKAYKTEQENKVALSEQDRLKKEQQYEALVPIKIEEALKPYLEQIKEFETTKSTLATKLAEAEKRYTDLQDKLKTQSLQDSLYSEFVNQKGDATLNKLDLWKLYGDSVKIDKDGNALELSALMETIKASTLGAKLFVTVTPVGSGTSGTKASATKEATDKPRVVTQAMLLNPRKHGINTADVKSGKIVVEG